MPNLQGGYGRSRKVTGGRSVTRPSGRSATRVRSGKAGTSMGSRIQSAKRKMAMGQAKSRLNQMRKKLGR